MDCYYPDPTTSTIPERMCTRVGSWAIQMPNLAYYALSFQRAYTFLYAPSSVSVGGTRVHLESEPFVPYNFPGIPFGYPYNFRWTSHNVPRVNWARLPFVFRVLSFLWISPVLSHTRKFSQKEYVHFYRHFETMPFWRLCGTHPGGGPPGKHLESLFRSGWDG
nr:hypothetical protein [Erysiphe necator associated mitovirus 39]